MTSETLVAEAEEIIQQLMAPVGVSDPYPLYDRLRTIAPNYRSVSGLRFASSYEVVAELLRSKDFGQSFGYGSDNHPDNSFISTVKESLILANPPQHTRLRKLVTPAFTVQKMNALTPRIQEQVSELLDVMAEKMADGGTADIVADLATSLPAMVLGEMLGSQSEDRDRLREWEEAIADNTKPVVDDELMRRADWATRELQQYIREVIAERRLNPGPDIISTLIRVQEDGDVLTESELVNMIWTLMSAGSQTTTATISVTAYLLLSRPELRAQIAADPDEIPKLVDEALRYEPVVQNSWMRVALRPTTLGGEPVAEGEHVVAWWAAANRDPAVFNDPDELSLDRRELGRSLAFGLGIHSCIGRALGRNQVIEALGMLLQRFPDLQLADQEITWRRLLPVRQLDHLYVSNGEKA